MGEFKESEHPRDKDGKFTSNGGQGSSNYQQEVNKRIKWAKEHNIDIPLLNDGTVDDLKLQNLYNDFMQKNKAQSGAISGALDSDSEEAQKHAEQYYEEKRHTTADIYNIAKNTGFSVEQIRKVKNYIFYEKHWLDGKYKRFDSDYDMAQSWQRLETGKNIKEMDIVLLNHELVEREYELKGYSHDEAHEKANEKYNYQNMVNEEKKNGKNKKH